MMIITLLFKEEDQEVIENVKEIYTTIRRMEGDRKYLNIKAKNISTHTFRYPMDEIEAFTIEK